MKTQNKFLLVSLISTLAGVGAAAAQGGPGKHFEELDANKDGTITVQEFQAHALTRWTEADANKDGKVTADELKAAHEAHAQEKFTSKDSNGDGLLQRSEIAKMPEEHFAKLDTNKDGALSKDEMAAMKGHFHKEGDAARPLPGDANNDGVVTKAEAVAGAQQFAAKIDSNGDGKLTKEEFKAAHPHGPHHGPRHQEG